MNDAIQLNREAHRVLVVHPGGPFGDLLCRGLEEAGHEVDAASLGDADDLFERAVDHDSILYVPSVSLLGGALCPQSDADRMASVLRAANAPGVRLVLLLVPEDGYEAEEDLLTGEGKPYFVIHSAPTAEELVEHARDTLGSRFTIVPRRHLRVVREAELTSSILTALDSEDVGRVVSVTGRDEAMATLVREAKPTGVFSLPDLPFRVVRPDLGAYLRQGNATAKLALFCALGIRKEAPAQWPIRRPLRNWGVACVALLVAPILLGLGASPPAVTAVAALGVFVIAAYHLVARRDGASASETTRYRGRSGGRAAPRLVEPATGATE